MDVFKAVRCFLSGQFIQISGQTFCVANFTARVSYARGLAAYLDRFAAMIASEGATAEQTRRDAIAAFSQTVGALVLSRAIAGADPAFADEILDAARRTLVGGTPPTAP